MTKSTRRDYLNEIEHWKQIAIYLADCHSANITIADLKSCSKYQKRRLQSIMETSAKLLSGKKAPWNMANKTTQESLDLVINRLERDANEINRMIQE